MTRVQLRRPNDAKPSRFGRPPLPGRNLEPLRERSELHAVVGVPKPPAPKPQMLSQPPRERLRGGHVRGMMARAGLRRIIESAGAKDESGRWSFHKGLFTELVQVAEGTSIPNLLVTLTQAKAMEVEHWPEFGKAAARLKLLQSLQQELQWALESSSIEDIQSLLQRVAAAGIMCKGAVQSPQLPGDFGLLLLAVEQRLYKLETLRKELRRAARSSNIMLLAGMLRMAGVLGVRGPEASSQSGWREVQVAEVRLKVLQTLLAKMIDVLGMVGDVDEAVFAEVLQRADKVFADDQPAPPVGWVHRALREQFQSRYGHPPPVHGSAQKELELLGAEGEALAGTSDAVIEEILRKGLRSSDGWEEMELLRKDATPAGVSAYAVNGTSGPGSLVEEALAGTSDTVIEEILRKGLRSSDGRKVQNLADELFQKEMELLRKDATPAGVSAYAIQGTSGPGSIVEEALAGTSERVIEEIISKGLRSSDGWEVSEAGIRAPKSEGGSLVLEESDVNSGQEVVKHLVGAELALVGLPSQEETAMPEPTNRPRDDLDRGGPAGNEDACSSLCRQLVDDLMSRELDGMEVDRHKTADSTVEGLRPFAATPSGETVHVSMVRSGTPQDQGDRSLYESRSEAQQTAIASGRSVVVSEDEADRNGRAIVADIVEQGLRPLADTPSVETAPASVAPESLLQSQVLGNSDNTQRDCSSGAVKGPRVSPGSCIPSAASPEARASNGSGGEQDSQPKTVESSTKGLRIQPGSRLPSAASPEAAQSVGSVPVEACLSYGSGPLEAGSGTGRDIVEQIVTAQLHSFGNSTDGKATPVQSASEVVPEDSTAGSGQDFIRPEMWQQFEDVRQPGDEDAADAEVAEVLARAFSAATWMEDRGSSRATGRQSGLSPVAEVADPPESARSVLEV